jgi:hypothetical protein
MAMRRGSHATTDPELMRNGKMKKTKKKKTKKKG